MLLNYMSTAFLDKAFLSFIRREFMSKFMVFESILGYFYLLDNAAFYIPSTELATKLPFWFCLILIISPVKS